MESVSNAIITSSSVEIEDHGILTCIIGLKGNGWGASFGGYALKTDSNIASEDFTGFFIRRLLETVGGFALNGLKDKPCRIKLEDGTVVAIGHFIEDKWFNPKEEFYNYSSKLEQNSH